MASWEPDSRPRLRLVDRETDYPDLFVTKRERVRRDLTGFLIVFAVGAALTLILLVIAGIRG